MNRAIFKYSVAKFALLLFGLEEIIDNFVLKEGGNVTLSKFSVISLQRSILLLLLNGFEQYSERCVFKSNVIFYAVVSEFTVGRFEPFVGYFEIALFHCFVVAY